MTTLKAVGLGNDSDFDSSKTSQESNTYFCRTSTETEDPNKRTSQETKFVARRVVVVRQVHPAFLQHLILFCLFFREEIVESPRGHERRGRLVRDKHMNEPPKHFQRLFLHTPFALCANPFLRLGFLALANFK